MQMNNEPQKIVRDESFESLDQRFNRRFFYFFSLVASTRSAITTAEETARVVRNSPPCSFARGGFVRKMTTRITFGQPWSACRKGSRLQHDYFRRPFHERACVPRSRGAVYISCATCVSTGARRKERRERRREREDERRRNERKKGRKKGARMKLNSEERAAAYLYPVFAFSIKRYVDTSCNMDEALCQETEFSRETARIVEQRVPFLKCPRDKRVLGTCWEKNILASVMLLILWFQVRDAERNRNEERKMKRNHRVAWTRRISQKVKKQSLHGILLFRTCVSRYAIWP